MDSVPMLFIESVCASLSRNSLENLKGCRSAVWKVGAVEKSEGSVNQRGLSYWEQSSCASERYAWISMLSAPGARNTEVTTIDGLKPLFAYICQHTTR
uniref:F-box domain-containing protein n=1 Tax=Steinernema glaseri TaxID=37863 RepID=A0A1I7ZJC4_9BILA